MRSIWTGAISFGLITIPVKLYSATEQRDVSFHQVHRADGGRIRYRRFCQVCGEEVDYADVVKGYELPDGDMVVLDEEDFAQLPLSTSRSIEVVQFVPLEQVDPIYFAKSYYLAPDEAATKPYVLLRDALEYSGKVAIVKLAFRQRESLATLRVRQGVFVLETMLWADEIREPDFEFLDEDVDVRPQELTMATSLIDTMTGGFEPENHHDTYRVALQQLIDAKIEGREVVQPSEHEEEPESVVDLMSALRASVEAAKEGRPAQEGAPPAQRSARAGAGSGRSDGSDTTPAGKGSRSRSGSGSSGARSGQQGSKKSGQSSGRRGPRKSA